MQKPHVVVVGSGISGLSTAWHLRESARVTVLEAEARLGGHTHTRLITLNGRQGPVDTGFIVFNDRTYPELLAWFAELGVLRHPADMSLSVSADRRRLEWCGRTLGSVFAQPKNLLSPRFWGMLADILRFNREATRLLVRSEQSAQHDPSLGEVLDRLGLGKAFESHYLLPMAGAIWSCPLTQMREMPFTSFARFCVNHGLLQILNRPQWYSVQGGSYGYIQRLLALLLRQSLPIEFRTHHEVASVTPAEPGSRAVVRGWDSLKRTAFRLEADAVVLAGHTDQSARLLEGSRHPALGPLKAFRYQDNTAYLHTDTELMPRTRAAWAAWNVRADEPGARVSVTYWMNQLQDLVFDQPVLVSLNPGHPPQAACILEQIQYSHPVFDHAAQASVRSLSAVQGEGRLWFSGAWTGFGFHEDGFRSGRVAAQGVLRHFSRIAARGPLQASELHAA